MSTECFAEVKACAERAVDDATSEISAPQLAAELLIYITL